MPVNLTAIIAILIFDFYDLYGSGTLTAANFDLLYAICGMQQNHDDPVHV